MSSSLAASRCLSIPKFLLFGDSLSQRSFSPDGCWGALLADKFVRKCDVVNRGFSGYNSRWCRAALPYFVNKKNVDELVGITILLGANDSTDPDVNQRQSNSLEEYGENMVAMVQYLQGLGLQNDQVILITPPMCHPPAWEPHAKMRGIPNSLSLTNVVQFAAKCRLVAQTTGVQCVDLQSAMASHKNYHELLVDGLHFSEAGSQLLFDLLQPSVDRVTRSLPSLLPMWDEIDIQDPKTSLEKLPE